MLLGLRKSWKSVISSSYGSTVKPLSSEVWSTLRSYGILAQFRGQRGGNHLTKIYSKKITTIESSAERKIYTGCKQRKANLCNFKVLVWNSTNSIIVFFRNYSLDSS